MVTVQFILYASSLMRTPLVAQTVKNLPAMWKTWVQSLGQEDPLEKGTATHSSVSCLENHMDRGAWRATVYGVAELDTTEQLSLFTHEDIKLLEAGVASYFSVPPSQPSSQLKQEVKGSLVTTVDRGVAFLGHL